MNLNLYDILQNILNESIDQNSVENAIANKQVIMMAYNDESGTPRTNKRWTEPYALVRMPSGDLAIRAFQYSGDTKRGIPHWKLFKLDRIVSWQPTTSKFTVSRDGYNSIGDKQYQVLKQVSFNNDDIWVQRNIKDTEAQNVANNTNFFGNKINKKNPQGPIQQNGNMSQQSNPSGPIGKNTKQHDWKKYKDLLYRQNKREKEKYQKNLDQNFSDEDEVMSDFDNKPLFN